MLARGGDHIASLKNELKEKLDGTVPALPTRWLSGQDETLNLGGMAIEVKHRKGGHTPGDLMVWLPQQRVVFSGDIVYVDRMLGVIPVSHTGRWLESFAALEALQPARIVPGHGEVCDLATAQAHTRDYLVALRMHMKKAVDDGRILKAADESGYPKTLAVLVEGVLDPKDPDKQKKIYFLRRLPRDPLHTDASVEPERTWGRRSYASPPDAPREGADVYDVYSLSERTGLNGVPYKEW